MISIQQTVHNSLENVWTAWTTPEHITQWNFASEDWCCPSASNDLQVGGKLCFRMEAKDGSMGFDLEGEYTLVDPMNALEFALSDGRKVEVKFTETDGAVLVQENFEPESENSEELQRAGWQAILDNFAKHAETL